MKKTANQSVVPYYAAAAVWLIWALLFPLYTGGHFLLVSVVSAAVFLLLRALCGNGAAKEKQPEPEKKKEEPPTGDPQLDKMKKDGAMAISEMRRLNDAIEDETISAQIDRLEEISGKIFAEVEKDPKKLPQIRKFMDYYLPTTLKILNAYDRMDSLGVQGENIDTTKQKVETMLSTIVAAFEKQLDALFGADALDISTDITVLETMLAREGLAGERLEAETVQNADETDIKLEL